MLNVSPNSIKNRIPEDHYESFGMTELKKAHVMFRNWSIALLILLFAFLCLPWRQNIRMDGYVTTLTPSQRPQTIESTIAGRIEKWYVQEGDQVKKGDTIVYLSEVKTDYFDPELPERTLNQLKAKEGATESYRNKIVAYEQQIRAMKAELKVKENQLEAKLRQTKFKLEAQEANLEQAKVNLNIAEYQFRRADTLLQKGIYSLTQFENANNKAQEARAKQVSAQTKVQEAQNEVQIAELNQSAILNEYATKIAKAESEKFSALSSQFNAEGDVNKLENLYESYKIRQSFYYITAPQDGYVNKALKPGIGETVKEGEPVLSIMPDGFELAVELYVKPMDLPLIQKGNEVLFIFDGWPAFVFSGWPDQSFGTFSGEIFAIDNEIDPSGRFRIMVRETLEDKEWPKALKIGGGAQGIAILGRVSLAYELWRRLNGFPADYYEKDESKAPKFKAPLKSVK
ncbi:MAG: HlyD family efflux transporter periplasmic adaptor subunit [Bacteroidota bacterium]